MERLKTGTEALHFRDEPTGRTIGDFWAWSSSDLLNNALRGSFGEFIVASALGIDLQHPRMDWQAYDFQYGDHKIEVKTSAYLQTWSGDRISKINFGIGPTFDWSAETYQYASEAKRQADVYVFCILACQDKEKVDPLDMNQWEFHVLHTDVLNARCPNQKTISLSSLEKLQPYQADYGRLAEVVDQVLRENTNEKGIGS